MRPTVRTALGATALLSTFLIAGCGSSGASSTPPGPYTGPTVHLSGTATYERVPATASGLNYAGTVIKPIRGATVEVRNAGGTTVYFRATTDATGAYSILAPASSSLLVYVRATLGSATSPDTRIVDNTASDALYGVYAPTTTTTVDATGIDLNAASGWGGTSYSSARASGPFAILDTIYDAHQLILGADAGIVWPSLLVGWSPNNSTAVIHTSNFNPTTGRISILGKADEDTDEFDDHVIAHEWGHFFEANFSRSDSLGGPHGADDILDETVAFGEGWGNAFSGMATRNRHYYDTNGALQAFTGVNMDLENDSVSDSATVVGSDPRKLDGGWSESSVQEICWDLFDGGDGMADADGDGVALGFTPLYQAFVGGQKQTPAFTSIYSFLDALKTANPSSVAGITALETGENIGAHDAFEQSAAGFARCTVLPTNGMTVTDDLDGHPLQTWTTYGAMDADRPGNKLQNRLLFRVLATSNGAFKVRATPLTPSDNLYLLFAGPLGTFQNSGSGPQTLTVAATAGQTLEFAVGSFATSGNTSGVTPFTIQSGTAGSFSKPSTPAKPPMPSGNG